MTSHIRLIRSTPPSGSRVGHGRNRLVGRLAFRAFPLITRTSKPRPVVRSVLAWIEAGCVLQNQPFNSTLPTTRTSLWHSNDLHEGSPRLHRTTPRAETGSRHFVDQVPENFN